MKLLLMFGVLIFTSSIAWSWGSLAHKASAKIAWNFLDKDTQTKVTEILNGGTISDASVWPDSARANPEWKFTIWFHFEKAPDNFTYLDNLRRQDDRTRKLGGLLEALYVAEDTLKDPKATKFDRENALKFVVHFVGDIHQPLHTGRIEDNSGNKIPIKWLGMDTNLHSVWDSQMIYLAYKNNFTDLTQDQSQVYANALMSKFIDLKPTPDMFVRYDDWMHESMVPRTAAYEFKDESEEAYTKRFIDVVDKRVFMAGLRIAYMMNRLVHAEKPTTPIETLRRSIIEIVGDFTEFVSLKPKFVLQN
ncbi:MAG: S1/P1 nuclease [Pseudobdellovibrio sp.]